MNKKLFLAVGLLWVVIAVVALTIFAMALAGFSFSKYIPLFTAGAFWDSSTLLKDGQFSLADINELSIDASYHAIKVTLVDGGNMAARQYGKTDSDAVFTSSESGGKLNINIDNKINIFNFGTSNPRLEIDLPRSYAQSVSLKTGSGSVNINGNPRWAETEINSGSGSFRLDGDIICSALKINTSSGSVNTHDMLAGSIKVGTSSGSIRLGDIQADGEASLNTSSGAINCGGIKAANLTAKATSGSVRAGNAAISGNAEVITGSGSQNLGKLNAETLKIKSTSGSLRYDGISGNGSVDCTSGSIHCDSLALKGDISISSASGSQRLALAPGQNIEVSASTTSGSIKADHIKLSYSDNRGNNAFGAVGNGADGKLTLKAASGSIIIS